MDSALRTWAQRELAAGLEIIGKLAAVLGVEPAELLKLPATKGKRIRC
jgi:hypothetical protein